MKLVTRFTLALFIYSAVKSFYVKQAVLKAFLKGQALDMDYTGHSLVLDQRAAFRELKTFFL